MTLGSRLDWVYLHTDRISQSSETWNSGKCELGEDLGGEQSNNFVETRKRPSQNKNTACPPIISNMIINLLKYENRQRCIDV